MSAPHRQHHSGAPALAPALALALAFALAPRPSAAQEEEELTQKRAIVRAQRLIEQGKQHFQAREYEQGIEVYTQAQGLLPDVKNLYVIATAYGYIPDACVNTLEAWERFFDECGECDYRDNALKSFNEQRKRCRVTLRVESPTPGLRVAQGGVDWGAAPLARGLVVAPYPRLSFSAPGHLPHAVDLVLKPNEGARTLTVRLVPDLKPSFLDAHRPFLGGVTGVASLTSLIFALSQGSAASDAVGRAEGVNEDLRQTQSAARANALRADYARISDDLDGARLGLWLGVSGAALLGGLSAWLWTRDPDVRIDPDARPEVQGLSSLRVSAGPGGGALTLSF